MAGSDTKFEKLTAQMEQMIMVTVPALKRTITALRNQELNQGASNYEEIQKEEAELNTLRKTYVQIINDLNELDPGKAKFKAIEIIKKRKQLDANYIRTLKEANQGNWKDSFFRNLPF